jgi:hypothetical protein
MTDISSRNSIKKYELLYNHDICLIRSRNLIKIISYRAHSYYSTRKKGLCYLSELAPAFSRAELEVLSCKDIEMNNKKIKSSMIITHVE